MRRPQTNTAYQVSAETSTPRKENMSAPNAITEAQRVVNEAYSELCQRIKTGKLRNSSRNGSMVVYRVREKFPELFAEWQSKGQLPSVKQLADAFYRVLQDTEFSRQLDWEKLPAALVPKNQEPAKFGDYRATEDLSKRMAEAHKADEKIRAQEKAKKTCLALIDSFTPVDKRGNVRFSLRDKCQKDWRERVAKAANFQALEANIRSEMKKIYEELEKPVYSGGGR